MAVRIPARNETGDQLLRSTTASGEEVQYVALCDSTGNPYQSRTGDGGLSDRGIIVRSPREPASFYAVFDRIVPAQNKYMAVLFNTSTTRKVVVHRVRVYNWQVTAVTGVLLEHELRRITARTAGSNVTPQPYDDADTLSAGITADHASTAVTDAVLLRRFYAASEEFKIGALTFENTLDAENGVGTLIYEKKEGMRGLTLRQDKGLACKCITNSTVGTVSFVFEFTDEVA